MDISRLEENFFLFIKKGQMLLFTGEELQYWAKYNLSLTVPKNKEISLCKLNSTKSTLGVNLTLLSLFFNYHFLRDSKRLSSTGVEGSHTQ